MALMRTVTVLGVLSMIAVIILIVCLSKRLLSGERKATPCLARCDL